MRVTELFEVSLGNYAHKTNMNNVQSQVSAAFAPNQEQKTQTQQHRTKGSVRAAKQTSKTRATAQN